MFESRPPVPAYDPHVGFIGKKRVEVPNYLSHSTALSGILSRRSARSHLLAGERLTRFMKERGLTFKKTGKDGVSRSFAVPVTTSLVSLPKPLFDEIEARARVLVFALRRVLQDLYGSESVRASAFVQGLPKNERVVFLNAVERSPHYHPALHHPVMQRYPFLDNVGLDLVLTGGGSMSPSISDDLPFRILELNAGSPSGASNNASLLEGLFEADPEMADSIGPVFPNNHYRILRETYRSLGEAWTGLKDGIQVILPPGGANGASPEIHQLAAYSGLVYCDPGQLFEDPRGRIRMRSSDGSNPVVTAAYSRINSDSALYDPGKGIFLRDPEDGRELYCLDTLKPWKGGRPEYLRDGTGRPVPLESDFAIPGVLDAIHAGKFYLGGLNRVIDNKILLPLLIEHAPTHFKGELEEAGLDASRSRLRAPEALPSAVASFPKIAKEPEEWVVKSPDLSGGSGVHILLSLSPSERKEILRKVRKNPAAFAYQRLVRIGRIPVAIREKEGRASISNRTADLRMWVFFGGEGLPKMPHNALVRFAPVERGPLSSIVNTSKGGGYAPFVVAASASDSGAVSARVLGMPLRALPLESPFPAFAGAQVIQLARMSQELRERLSGPSPGAKEIFDLVRMVKTQAREVASFLDPRCMEPICRMEEQASKVPALRREEERALRRIVLRAELAGILKSIDRDVDARGAMEMDRMLDQGGRFKAAFLESPRRKTRPRRSDFQKLEEVLRGIRDLDRLPRPVLSARIISGLERELSRFFGICGKHLRGSPHSRAFSPWFQKKESLSPVVFRESFLSNAPRTPRVSIEWEISKRMRLSDSEMIPAWVRQARTRWLEVIEASHHLPASEKDAFLRDARRDQFQKFPKLSRLQSRMSRTGNRKGMALIPLLDVLPSAAFNLRSLAEAEGVSLEELLEGRSRIGIEFSSARSGVSVPAGECLIRKAAPHGLLSEGKCIIRIDQSGSELVQAFTLGHEAAHAFQLKEVMEAEARALRAGGDAFSEMMSRFSWFLASSSIARDGECDSGIRTRVPVHGLPDRMNDSVDSSVIRDLRSALGGSGERFQKTVREYGGGLGYLMEPEPGIRVKALREVIPALENAKNLHFAEECGLVIPLEITSSVLPAASPAQVKRYREAIEARVRDWMPHPETHRIIANHQLFGVRFPLTPGIADGGWREPLRPVYPSRGYNLTEQQ